MHLDTRAMPGTSASSLYIRLGRPERHLYGGLWWRRLGGYPDDNHYSHREGRSSRWVQPATGTSQQDYAVRSATIV